MCADGIAYWYMQFIYGYGTELYDKNGVMEPTVRFIILMFLIHSTANNFCNNLNLGIIKIFHKIYVNISFYVFQSYLKNT